MAFVQIDKVFYDLDPPEISDLEEFDDGKDEKCLVCYKDSKLRCNKCSRAYYCGRDHQMGHWPSHAHWCNTTKNASMTDIDRGRYLRAELCMTWTNAKNVRQGDTELQASQVGMDPELYLKLVRQESHGHNIRCVDCGTKTYGLCGEWECENRLCVKCIESRRRCRYCRKQKQKLNHA